MIEFAILSFKFNYIRKKISDFLLKHSIII
ncbi:hypothetical protein UACE39S_02955 [Ureibacillus acetophenoni]